MGMLVPFLSAALILRVWKREGWRFAGSWWGFAVLVAIAAITFWRTESMFLLTVHGNWLIQLPPLPLVACLYGVALVWLFGGKPLLRAAWFPVALLLLVIPVPGVFARAIDLPLQYAAAGVTRHFAHLLGVPLTADRLRLMYTPEFGVFIAPGCDGIRGAVTLGLAAVVVCYLYRFRWTVFAPVVASAVFLGYIFNLLRLCGLVIFGKTATSVTSLQPHEQLADHLIGGALFLLAVSLFFSVVNRLRRDRDEVLPPAPDAAPNTAPAVPVWARAAAVLALAAIFAVDAHRESRREAAAAAMHPVVRDFPQQIGTWTLRRTWTEQLIDGTIVYTWGQYQAPLAAPGAIAPVVDLGISPTLGLHDVTVCHLARGENALLSRQIDVPTAAGAIPFSLQLYSDAQTTHIEAATTCEAGQCRQFAQASGNTTLVYTAPRRLSPLSAPPTRPIPVLLKATLPDGNLTNPATTAAAMDKLSADITAFAAALNLPALTAPYERAVR